MKRGILIIKTTQQALLIRFLMQDVFVSPQRSRRFFFILCEISKTNILFCIQRGSALLTEQLLITLGAFELKIKVDKYFSSIKTQNKIISSLWILCHTSQKLKILSETEQ